MDMFIPFFAGHCNLSTIYVIFNCIFHKIIYKPVDKDIASRHGDRLTFPDQPDIFACGKWFQVGKHFLYQCIQGNHLIPGYCLKLTHIQKGLDHFAKTLILLRHHFNCFHSRLVITRMRTCIVGI